MAAAVRALQRVMAEAAVVLKKPKVLVVAGTTAVGKTDLSLELAKLLDGEVISADSVQVFKCMDVGSAKITPEECRGIPHHLLDVATIREPFTAADYYEHAHKAIEGVLSRGRVPLVVGGTGLYIQTLMQGPTGAPPSSDESRAAVEKMVEEDGHSWDNSLTRLKALDEQYAASLVVNDWYRLKRALQICTLSGRTVTSFKKEDKDIEDCPYEFKCLFLTMPRVKLFQRIDMRCEAIIEQGLFKEVISLVSKEGLVMESQAGRSVGYRQALEYLRAVWGFPPNAGGTEAVPQEVMHTSFWEFLATYKARTRQLARVQLSWFKTKKQFHWLNMAPGGQRLPLGSIADKVVQWFTDNTPFPEEWSGTLVQELTVDDRAVLKEYSNTLGQPTLFSDISKVDCTLLEIAQCLRTTQPP